jgi:hypothetical protein
MALFPDEFPFKRPGVSASVEPVQEPPVEHIPAPASVVAPAPAPAPAVELFEDEEPIPEPPVSAHVAVDRERRRSPRQSLIARALVRNERNSGPGWKVDLLNISMLGLRFRSNQSLLPGDVASVKLEVGPVRWATKLRVIHSAKLEDGNYSIGCQFVANELARPSARRAA